MVDTMHGQHLVMRRTALAALAWLAGKSSEITE